MPPLPASPSKTGPPLRGGGEKAVAIPAGSNCAHTHSAADSITAIVALYDERLLNGDAPPPEEFCAQYPQYTELSQRLLDLQSVRGDLAALFARDSVIGVDTGPSSLHDTPPSIPGFQVQRILGRGGMGIVYLAEQQSPRRPCALKVMGAGSGPGYQRFKREADLAARLNHPGVATVFDFGVSDGEAYLAYEWVRGFPLRDLMRAADMVSPQAPDAWFIDAILKISQDDVVQEYSTNHAGATTQARLGRASQLRPESEGSRWGRNGRSPEAQAPVRIMMDLALQVAEALAHAHEHGVVHRDVKPSNIIVGFDGRAKLIDFGIATRHDSEDARMTRTGTFVGSYGYAAPEQLRGEHEAVGPWSDTYALGAMLYEMLTQRMPFDFASFADRLTLVDKAPAFGPRHFNRKVPPALDAIVMRALNPEPAYRFHDGEELADALRACPRTPSWLPLLPWHHLRWLWPERWGARFAVLLVGAFLFTFGAYDHERQRNRIMLVDYHTGSIINANALLTTILDEERVSLENCLLGDRQLLRRSAMQARYVAEVVIDHGKVKQLRHTDASLNLGPNALECIGAQVWDFNFAGTGYVEPVTLRVDWIVGRSRARR